MAADHDQAGARSESLAREAGDSVAALVAAIVREAELHRDRSIARVDEVNRAAVEAAQEVLARVGAIEDRLDGLVDELRGAAARVPDHAASRPPPEPVPGLSVEELQVDVRSIAANLRMVMGERRAAPPPESATADE